MPSKKSTTEAAAEETKKAVEATSAGVDEAVEATTEAVAEAAAQAKVTAEKAQAAGAEGYAVMIDLQKDNFEAAVKAGTIAAKGYEAIGQEMLAFAQAALEANFALAQAVMGATTLHEAVDLQQDHVRKSLDQAVAESGKLGEMSVTLASEAIAPLQARMNATVERFVKPLAA